MGDVPAMAVSGLLMREAWVAFGVLAIAMGSSMLTGSIAPIIGTGWDQVCGCVCQVHINLGNRSWTLTVGSKTFKLFATFRLQLWQSSSGIMREWHE